LQTQCSLFKRLQELPNHSSNIQLLQRQSPSPKTKYKPHLAITMCVKIVNQYLQCGCQDTVQHIQICADKLNDEISGIFGYARCSDAEMGYEMGTPMKGWCPRCQTYNLDVVGNKLVPKVVGKKKTVPDLVIFPKVKDENGEPVQVSEHCSVE